MSAVGLAGQPQHHVELERRHAVRARQLRGAEQVAFLGLALDDVAHPLGRAVGRGGQRAVAAALQQPDDLVVQAVGAQAGDADLAARVDDCAQDLGHPRVVGDRGADQSDAARVVRDQRLDLGGRDQPHAAVRRPPHHAVRAAAVAAALRLDQEHVGELGVRRPDLRIRGQVVVGGGGDRGQPRAVQRRDVEPGARRQLGEQRVAVGVRADRGDQLGQRLLRLAHQDDVGVGRGGHRIRKRQRTADDDERGRARRRRALVGEQPAGRSCRGTRPAPPARARRRAKTRPPGSRPPAAPTRRSAAARPTRARRACRRGGRRARR